MVFFFFFSCFKSKNSGIISNFSSEQKIQDAVTLIMHQGCASEHSLSPSHKPSPCTLALPHPAPGPPSSLPHPAIWSFSHNHTQAHTHAHTHTVRNFFSPHFLSRWKTGWRGSFRLEVTVETPLFSFCQTCFHCNTHAHTLLHRVTECWTFKV